MATVCHRVTCRERLKTLPGMKLLGGWHRWQAGLPAQGLDALCGVRVEVLPFYGGGPGEASRDWACAQGPALRACSVPAFEAALHPSSLPSTRLSLTAPQKMQFESSHFQLPRCSVLSPRGNKGPVFPPGNVWGFPGARGERKRKWS